MSAGSSDSSTTQRSVHDHARFPRKPVVVILMGGGLALCAGVMTLGYLNSQRVPAPVTSVETRRVVVAAQPISRGQAVEPELVAQLELPVETVPNDALKSPEEVVGKLARSKIYADDVLTAAKFLDTQSTSALSGLIPKGRRAISIKVNEVTGISGFVAPGSRVDLLLVLPGHDDVPPRTLTIVQDLEVLAIAQSTEQHDGHATVVSTVTLNVSPRESEKIAVSMQVGKLHLALRNDRDDEHVWLAGRTLDELMDGTVSGAVGVGVELIRGIERLMLTF